jgi:hypothetical protein
MIGLRCILYVRAHVVVVGADVGVILRALRYLPKRPSSQRPPINFQKPSQTHLASFHPRHAAYSTPSQRNAHYFQQALCSRIRRSSDFDVLVVGEIDVCYERICVEWIQIESWEGG